VIKWTDDLGVWGDARRTDQLLTNAQARLKPIVQSIKPATDDDYSHTNFATKWNNLVIYVFNMLAVLPSKVSGAVLSKLHSIQAPPPEAESKPEPE
ncbi:hypothetical protein GN156_26265, partial [bacterium LRH843]|nr:hypothetical protein [bacterium LRH843]